MPILHLICGLPGSGKSTLAAQLACQDKTVWLSGDEWMNRIVGPNYDEARRVHIEDLQWDLAKRLLSMGIDVVLDDGFWTRTKRDAFRSEAATLGISVQLHFLEVPIAELRRRIAARNIALPKYAFHISDRDLETCIQIFEPPGAEELWA